jgi:hypothetical protein
MDPTKRKPGATTRPESLTAATTQSSCTHSSAASALGENVEYDEDYFDEDFDDDDDDLDDDDDDDLDDDEAAAIVELTGPTPQELAAGARLRGLEVMRVEDTFTLIQCPICRGIDQIQLNGDEHLPTAIRCLDGCDADAIRAALIPPPPAPVDPLALEIQRRLDYLRADREARRILADEERPGVEYPPIRGLTDILDEPDDETPYRIQGVWPDGARIMLAAQAKAGKTHTVGNVIRSLVDADPFLDVFIVRAAAQRVVLIDNEMSPNQIRRWLRDQRIRNVDAVDVVSLRGHVGTFDLVDERVRGEWAARIRATGADVVVLDCLRPIFDALGLDENRDAGRFLVAFDALLAEAGVTDALVVHHMGHSGERTRGDSRLRDWPDAAWHIVRENDEQSSDRYFSAYGRDVNLPEGLLTLDGRRLAYAPTNRKDVEKQKSSDEALNAVVAILTDDTLHHGGAGMGVNALEKAVSDAYGIGNRRVTDARKRGEAKGILRVTTCDRRPGFTTSPSHRVRARDWVQHPCTQSKRVYQRKRVGIGHRVQLGAAPPGDRVHGCAPLEGCTRTHPVASTNSK